MIVRTRLLAALSAAALAAGGCTLLIPFDEITPEGDAGLTDHETSPPEDARVGDGDATSPPIDAGVNDGAVNYDACVGHIDGYYCGMDQIPWPNKDDQVTCGANKVTKVRHCSTGQGCIRMLDGYPDECDDCTTKADGTYCGRDFAAWQAKNANQRVRCQGGTEVGLLLCTTCKSNGAASACQ